MKIGVGIDTGGTCTDAVIYQLESRKILASAKTLTTKEDLSVGIGLALDGLPCELLEQADVIALSTTLATNACVENKGGRAKLILFGADAALIARVGREFGLPVDESIICIPSHTKPTGEITQAPDWTAFEAMLDSALEGCDAVAVVESFAKKTGAQLERRARELIRKKFEIPVVCGHELFSEYNVAKRGASALLNARLIPVIREFLDAVRKALCTRGIKTPFVIVRSDGSLMTEAFAENRPVETLLCGPVASVMGAMELCGEDNGVIVDIGGTTTDIAFVKAGHPQRVEGGVRIGKWDTFVKGLFVDTFGLGGDSGVSQLEQTLEIETERVMPLCVAAERYPVLLEELKRDVAHGSRVYNKQKDIYAGIRDIGESAAYTPRERRIAAALLERPMSLEKLGKQLEDFILPSHIQRLLSEGVIIRCGVTPTDAMHIRGDFTRYSSDAARCGLQIMGRRMGLSAEELAGRIYEEVNRKLYCNVARILIEDAYPSVRKQGVGEQLQQIIADAYERAKRGEEARVFCGLQLGTPAVLIGVGAPTHIFLREVGRLLGAEVRTPAYSGVANALGAVVGDVRASVTMEVSYDPQTGRYPVFGCGLRYELGELEEAKALAERLASEKALEEAVRRGSAENAEVSLEVREETADTEFGSVYIGYQVVATATGQLDLRREAS